MLGFHLSQQELPEIGQCVGSLKAQFTFYLKKLPTQVRGI